MKKETRIFIMMILVVSIIAGIAASAQALVSSSPYLNGYGKYWIRNYTDVNASRGKFDNLSVDLLTANNFSYNYANGVKYILADNYTDLRAQLAVCSDGDYFIIPTGTYTGSGTFITINCSNVTVRGMGWDTLIIRSSGSNFVFTPIGSNTVIKDLAIDLTDGESYGIASTSVQNVGNIKIDNVYIYDTNGSAISLGGAGVSGSQVNESNINEIWVTNSKIENCRNGIHILGRYAYIHNNILIGDGNESNSSENGEGIELNVRDRVYGSPSIISDNIIKNFGEQGADINGAWSVVSGNHFEGAENVTAADVSDCLEVGEADHTAVTGNTFINCQKSIDLITNNGVTVTGNTISGNGSGIGIHIINTDHSTISANTIDGVSTGIDLTSGTSEYNTIGFNDFGDDVTVNVLLNDTNTNDVFNDGIFQSDVLLEWTTPLSDYGRILYLPMNYDADDHSGFGNDLSADNATITADGHIGAGYSFNSVNQSLSRAALTDIDPDKNFSVSLWFYYLGGGDVSLISQRIANANNLMISIESNEIRTGIYNGTSYQSSRKDVDVDADTWYHVVYAYNKNGTGDLYLDAIKDTGGSGSTPSLAGSTSDFYVGRKIDMGNPMFFNGTIDEVMVWNRTMSQKEVYALYSQNSETYSGEALLKSGGTVKGDAVFEKNLTFEDGHAGSLSVSSVASICSSQNTYTRWSNISDQICGGINGSLVNANHSDTCDTATTWDGETDQGDINANHSSTANSSANWDDLDSPSDINAGDITDDNTYVLVAGDTVGDLVVDGDLTVLGDSITANVSEINLNGSFLPQLNNTFDLGSPAERWNDAYINTLDVVTALTDAQISDTLTCSVWDGETSQLDINANHSSTANSSANWDDLDSPSDINAGDITDDNTYVLVAGDTVGDLVVDGDLGIGTTTPSHEFNVVGDANITSALYIGTNLTVLDDIILSENNRYCGDGATCAHSMSYNGSGWVWT